jgi:hypothetical protein
MGPENVAWTLRKLLIQNDGSLTCGIRWATARFSPFIHQDCTKVVEMPYWRLSLELALLGHACRVAIKDVA